jgi:hypothetical protein
MSPNALPATAPSTAPSRQDCGCGGGGSCGGGCGGGCAASAAAATAFVRPRFFAGQLLTEDDLGLLTTYVTGKNRLHNRYLFGPGVVCGLGVACDPCGGGTVSVQPGYALDCCGNDLVLACAATLDINAMIRDLRARLGKDCGDPCSEQAKQSGAQQGAVTRRYCLYVRYGEEATDPVAPYATEEPCGQTACEPTRLREGISFVLKCPEREPPSHDLWYRLKKCMPNKDILGETARLMAYGTPMMAAAEAVAHPPAYVQKDADELGEHLGALGERPADIPSGRARQVIETVRALAANLARYDLARDPPKFDEIPKARAVVGDVARALRESAETAWDDPLDRAAAGALLEQARQLADTNASQPPPRLAMLAQGRPVDDSVLSVLRSSTVSLLEWLLARVASDTALGDCELRTKLAAISVTTATSVDEAVLRSVGRTSSALIDLVTRYVTDCSCAALNPPCVPCEDSDVLLACLEVRDCEVVRICNAERDYVVSGSALRYWLPGELLHERIECFCCQERPRYRLKDKELASLSFQEPGFGAAEPADVPWELLGLPQPGGPLRTVLQRAGIPLAARAAPEAVRTLPVPPAPAPAAAAGAPDAVTQQLTALTQQVTQLTSQLTDTENRLAGTESQLTDTENRLGGTESQLTDTENRLAGAESQLTQTQTRLTETQSQLTETQTRLTALANRPAAAPTQPARPRRPAGPRSTAGTQQPPASPGTGTATPGSSPPPGPGTASGSPAAPGTGTASGSPAAPGTGTASSGSPEAGNAT